MIAEVAVNKRDLSECLFGLQNTEPQVLGEIVEVAEIKRNLGEWGLGIQITEYRAYSSVIGKRSAL